MIPSPTVPDAHWTAGRTRRNITMLALAALLVLSLLVTAFLVDRQRAANRVHLERVNSAQVQRSELFGLSRDMESALRGYLLQGDETFLDPYNVGYQTYPDAAGALRNLIESISQPDSQVQQNLTALEDAARAWREHAGPSLAQRRQNIVDDTELQEVLATSRTLFDEIRSRDTTLKASLEEQSAALGNVQHTYNTVSLVLFLLITGTTLATLGYGISLIRQVGFLASALQGRHQRQQAYTNVISTLNGPTQLAPLLQGVLPKLADSVGAQAAVVYSLEGDQLIPVDAVGLDSAALQPLAADGSLPGRALREERMLLIDTEASDVGLSIQTGLGPASPNTVVYLPLRYGNHQLGVLVVASIQALDTDEVQQLVLTASQLATAISTVHAFEATQKLADELSQQNERLEHSLETSETMQEIGRELVIQSDLQTVLTLVCSEARRLLRADYTAVATVCDDQGSTRWVAVDGVRSQRWHEHIFAPHCGIAGRAIDQAGTIVLDASSEDRSLMREEYVLQLEEGMQGVLGVPLFRKATPIGALIVGYRSDHNITPSEMELAQSLAAYASIAIENARLLAELQGERDLAEQRARELTAKNQEVERANRLKSEFMANMSHELRTPLNSILALSQILLDRLDGELTPEQAKQIEIIERNGRNLLRLINDILDLSKIEAGRMDMRVGEVQIDDLIGAARSTVAPLAAQKNIELRTKLDPDLPRFYTDENKLKQILLNLLSNAVKFTEYGSVTIRVVAGRTGAQPGDDQQWITFEVEDTGIGIAPEDQAVVWEEFRQIDGSLSRRYEGTGLGLAIVRRIVTLLGGGIALESTPGAGSLFRFWLPANNRDQAVDSQETRFSPLDAVEDSLDHTQFSIAGPSAGADRH